VISTSRSDNRESGDEIECAESRDFRPVLAFLGELGETHEWVAGAEGIEPRYGDFELA
jgi:hypothetical protein